MNRDVVMKEEWLDIINQRFDSIQMEMNAIKIELSECWKTIKVIHSNYGELASELEKVNGMFISHRDSNNHER